MPTRHQLPRTSPSSPEVDQLINEAPKQQSPVEILSDSQGVDFGPYIKGIVDSVRLKWYGLVPAEARAPQMKQGKVELEFHIDKTGAPSAARIVLSSGDDALDGACVQAVQEAGSFGTLPSDFKGDELSLRFHFYYNPGSEPAEWITTNVRSTSESPIPKALYTKNPSYPLGAKRDKRQGTVVVSLVVKRSGFVDQVRVVRSAGKDLDHAALEAVQTWVYYGPVQDGKSIETPLNIEIGFHLR